MEIYRINPLNRQLIIKSINRWIENHNAVDVKITLLGNSLRMETRGMAYGPMYVLGDRLAYFVEGIEMMAEIRREKRAGKP